MKFDDIFKYLGEFGKYQRWVYFLVCLPAILAAFHMLATVFILATPKHRCAIPGLDNDTYQIQSDAHHEMVSLYIPITLVDGEPVYAECTRFLLESEATGLNVNVSEAACSSWVYDKSVFLSTVISDFDLVCDRQNVRSHANMVLMAGLLVGSITLGLVSDIIGRKKTFAIGLGVWVVAAFSIAFSPTVEVFIVLRFFTGACGVGLFLCMFVLGLEMVGPSRRTIAGMGMQLMWCVGLFILGGIGFGVRNWQYLQIAITIPSLALVVLWWLIPESPRWLISKGRKKEAAEILQRVAKMNNRLVPPRVLSLENIQEDHQEKVWVIFTSPVLVVRSIIIFFNWCVVSMVYYGLGLNVGELGGDIYVNFTIANVVEAVSYVLCILLLDRVGRKVLHCVSMVVGGVACIITIFPVLYGGKSLEWLTITFAMIGKLGASAAFAIIYVFTAELYPTVVRNSAMGASSLCARIGGIASPYIADLGNQVVGDFSQALPLLVFGALSVIAGLLALDLPETLNRKLPESINDAVNFGGKEDDSNVRYKDFHSTTSDLASDPRHSSVSDLPSGYPSTTDLSSRKISIISEKGSEMNSDFDNISYDEFGRLEVTI